jgi:hypothetical protein
MNERIKELALQAGATTTQRSGWIDYGTLDLDVEKFAELIVRECLLKIENERFELPDFIIDSVKQHFGVEE